MLGQRTLLFFNKHENVQLLGTSLEESSVYTGIDYLQCDISNREKIKNLVANFCPDIIVNAAAFTNVDLCEKERETSWKINVKGVEYLAEAARIIDAHLIHMSSDYIFDGTTGPYAENAIPNPVGYYGRTKLASENALKISHI